jgi:hypothetical protein
VARATALAAAPQAAQAISNERFSNTADSATAGSAKLPPTTASANWGTTQAPGSRKSRPVLPVVLALGVVGVGAVGWLLGGRAKSEGAADVASAVLAHPAAPSAVEPLAPVTAAEPVAVAPPPPAAPSATSAPSAVAPPPATPAPLATAAKAGGTKPRAPAVARPAAGAAPPKPETVQEDPWSRK